MSTLPKAVPSKVQQPFQITWGQVHSCLWMESEDGWLVADKVSEEMDLLVVGLLEWIFLYTWGVMRPSRILGQREICDTQAGQVWGGTVAKSPQGYELWPE